MNLKQFYTRSSIGFVVLVVVILIGIAVTSFRNNLSADRTTPESAEFAQKIQSYVVENRGQPIDNDLSVDEIISRTENDTSSHFVSVGDILGAMTVVRVAPFNTGQYSRDPKMIQIGPRNIQITLQGPVEVIGAYSAVHSAIGFDGYCMSVSDVASLACLPVLPVGGIRPNITSYSFCFRNGEDARRQLGEESRTITVKIDNFELNAYPAEVMTWADLASVVKE